MTQTITIPYKPRKIANEILHDTNKRWNVIIAHRRFCKTVATLNHLQRDALKIPSSRFAYIAPTYKQAKNVAWDYLKYYSRDIPGVKINESELRVDYPNGGRVTLYGADNPDSLRGIKLWGVGFDEYSQQPSNIFSEIIRPALADTRGYAIWIGTPKGRNEFVKLYEDNKHKKKWNCQLITIQDSREREPDVYESLYEEALEAKKTMTTDEWEQEWMCNFDAAIRGAYYADCVSKAREDKRVTSVPYEHDLEVHTFWDLGISDYTVIGFFQVYGKEVRLIDYYENHGFGLGHYVEYLEGKGYNYGTHNFPHDIQVRELGTGKSRKETLEGLGITVKVVKNLSIEDGINAGRLLFDNLWIDETKCRFFLDAVSQYRQEWDDKKGCFKNTPLHDWTSHAADMYRYASIGVKNMMQTETVHQYVPDLNKLSYNNNSYT